MKMNQEFDVIVVGGGPAGAALASRLSEDSDRAVLLIEAGPDYGMNRHDWPSELLDISVPALTSHTWSYFNRSEGPGDNLFLPAARVLGGNSAVNGCVWLRPSKCDFEEWSAFGPLNWTFDDVIPAYQRAETDHCPSRLHGRSGPVQVYRAHEDELSDVDCALLESAPACGLEVIDDLNGSADQFPCAGLTPKNIVDAQRFSGVFSYLEPARTRSNLTILGESFIDSVLIDGSRACGVQAADGTRYLAAEVVLTAGAYGSPAILMRSGIGPVQHLRDRSVTVTHALSGLGANLMDHPQIDRHSGFTSFVLRRDALRNVFIQTMIKARSQQITGDIDLHLYPAITFNHRIERWTLTFAISLQYSRSRGRVRLDSNTTANPIIDHNYLSDIQDREALCDGYELMLNLVHSSPLIDLIDRNHPSFTYFTERDSIRQLVCNHIGTTFHPSSTCMMGLDPENGAVVDDQCRVYGVEKLRVADASILPFDVRANLHYTVVAVAERVAEFMRA
jgi:choline dehydrogenase